MSYSMVFEIFDRCSVFLMNYHRMRSFYLEFHPLDDWFICGVWNATRVLAFLDVVEPEWRDVMYKREFNYAYEGVK